MDDANRAAALEAVFRSVDGLVPYARNARTHDDAQVAQIAASIEEFGWTNPVLADEKGIVAGHGRVMAARKLYEAGRTIRLPNGIILPHGTVPVIDCSGWSEGQRKAYVLADNQLALNAGWDMELLKVELRDLADSGFGLELTGFSQEQLGDIFGAKEEKETNPDNEDIGGDRFLVLIECKDEGEQQQLFTELQERGLSCKIS